MWPITAEEDTLLFRDVISNYDFFLCVFLCLRVMYSFACICSRKGNHFVLYLFHSEYFFVNVLVLWSTVFILEYILTLWKCMITLHSSGHIQNLNIAKTWLANLSVMLDLNNES